MSLLCLWCMQACMHECISCMHQNQQRPTTQCARQKEIHFRSTEIKLMSLKWEPIQLHIHKNVPEFSKIKVAFCWIQSITGYNWFNFVPHCNIHDVCNWCFCRLKFQLQHNKNKKRESIHFISGIFNAKQRVCIGTKFFLVWYWVQRDVVLLLIESQYYANERVCECWREEKVLVIKDLL